MLLAKRCFVRGNTATAQGSNLANALATSPNHDLPLASYPISGFQDRLVSHPRRPLAAPARFMAT